MTKPPSRDQGWQRWELVNGELEFISPADPGHEEALWRLMNYLFGFCRLQPAWACLASNVVFTMASGNWRMPDTSLVRTESCPRGMRHAVVPPRELDTWSTRCEWTDAGIACVVVPPRDLNTAKIDYPPDVAFEIRSRSDRSSQVQGKRMDYQESGVIQVWIDLENRLTEVIYPNHPPQYFSEDQALVIDQPVGLSLDLRSLYLT